MKEPNFSKMVHKTIRLKGPDKTLHLIHICKLINQLCISNYLQGKYMPVMSACQTHHTISCGDTS